MVYSVASLSTVAECDSVTALVEKVKADLIYKQGLIQHKQAGFAVSSVSINAELSGVNVQLTAFEGMVPNLPAGPLTDDNNSKIEGLNHRKFLLLKKQKESGSVALLESEMEFGLNEKQVAELHVILAAIAARKAAL